MIVVSCQVVFLFPAGPAYPLQLMPSSETVFIPLYLSEGTVHEHNGLQDSTDFLTSTACDPEFVIR